MGDPRQTTSSDLDAKGDSKTLPFRQTGQTTDASWRLWVIGGISAAVLATGFLGFMSWRNAAMAAEDADWVAHTHAVKTSIESVLRYAVDVETGARAFDVTGDEAFLEPYVNGRRQMAEELRNLQRLIADNPEQLRQLELLEPQIMAKFEFSDRMVSDRRRSRRMSSVAEFHYSKKLMDAIRDSTGEMQAEETKLLEQRAQATEAERRSAKIATAGGTVLSVLFLLLAGFVAGREINNSARARAQLAALNTDLERRVEQRTAALRSSEAHLRTQAEELARSEAKVRQLNQQLEQRVRARTAELEATNKELEAFTYSVSHDLRAPLRHIAGFSKMLAEECQETLAPEALHYLQRIQDGVQRMGALVDDLLNLTRIGRQELRLQVTGLESLAREVIADLAPDTEGRKVEWRLARLPYVEGDPALLKQVFQNLLSNALKYSRPRSPAIIEIGCQEQDGQRAIFVRDNGVGFSMKHSDKLFGVFQRLHRNEDFEGTGVGLATVHRIVQKHSGRIWAQAEVDKGATFYFALGNSRGVETEKHALMAGGGA